MAAVLVALYALRDLLRGSLWPAGPLKSFPRPFMRPTGHGPLLFLSSYNHRAKGRARQKQAQDGAQRRPEDPARSGVRVGGLLTATSVTYWSCTMSERAALVGPERRRKTVKSSGRACSRTGLNKLTTTAAR